MSEGAQPVDIRRDNAAPQAPRILSITREFSASRERVWRAFTEPQALRRWHGPAFYPVAELEADVRAGGAWRACLKSGRPADVALWQSGRYLVVAPPERLEFTFAWETPGHEDGPDVVTHVSIRFEATAEGGTRMHFTQTGFLSQESTGSHALGWNGTFDRLEEFLQDNGRLQDATGQGGF